MTVCGERLPNGLLCERPQGHSEDHWAPFPEPLKMHLSEIGHIEDTKGFLLGILSERGVRSLELIADALQTLAKVESERLSREYPPERSPRGAQINRVSDDKREQYSDKADRQWLEETENALPQIKKEPEKSRFEERLEQERKRTEAAAKK
jgi:hypothetical protein